MDLEDLGWNTHFENAYQTVRRNDYQLARISSQYKGIYGTLHVNGESLAKISGKIYHHATEKKSLPVVGDWVLLANVDKGNNTTIQQVLPRKTSISRSEAGTYGKREGKAFHKEQVMAANVDVLFLVSGLDRDFNLRRIERYLTIAYNSGAKPVVLLNKADLCPDADQKISEVESIAFGVPIHLICAKEKSGIDDLFLYFKKGLTGAFLGSSGVGKSTIINQLLGYDRQKTLNTSEAVGKGVHTTTVRELIVLPTGGLVLDNPGMRELKLWDSESGIGTTFQDIETLTKSCRFSDCSHEGDPGCAVLEAIESGTLDEKRFHSYLKLVKEEQYYKDKKHKSANTLEKEKWKKINQFARKFKKNKNKMNI